MNVSLEVRRENQSLWDFNIESDESNFTVCGSVNKDLALYDKESLISNGELDIDDLFFWVSTELEGYAENRG